MMSSERLWTRDSQGGWMGPFLVWPEKWLQLLSTEVSTTSSKPFILIPHERNIHMGAVFYRLWLPLQWIQHVWVQHGQQETVPCPWEWLLLEMHQLLDFLHVATVARVHHRQGVDKMWFCFLRKDNNVVMHLKLKHVCMHLLRVALYIFLSVLIWAWLLPRLCLYWSEFVI